ncbi:MAG: restriction endonuclease [Eggerthellaceae bacterium]|jgi:restriction system protein|nr:restriction endonuclease [Eggerthellaceae bacterium]
MTAWMIRAGRGGSYASKWLNNGTIAIFWDLDGASITKMRKDDIKVAYAKLHDAASSQEVAAAAGQISRFANEMVKGSTVVMYDPSSRLYHLGRIDGGCVMNFDDAADAPSYSRKVIWEKDASRDSLSPSSKNSLGSISTIFAISPETMDDLERAANNQDEENEPILLDDDADDAEVRYATADDGIERIKDKVLNLSWDDMELLVAGLLRTMGYKTSMTKKGSDGGRDVIASPDGLGLESPCIIAEVKHRKNAMGAPEVRAFIGGLRSSDSGLYVSTGGFTKEAQYEADRAIMPLRLLDLDRFVRLLVDNYDAADAEMRTILPLVRIYWPA